MLRAAADGHRVVLTVATHGEEGEVADGFLDGAVIDFTATSSSMMAVGLGNASTPPPFSKFSCSPNNLTDVTAISSGMNRTGS